MSERTRTIATLESIVKYYDRTRQIGHTELMLRGVNNVDKPVFVSHNEDGGRYLLERTSGRARYLSLYGLTQTLYECNSPIVFDNAAIHFLLRDSLRCINQRPTES